MFIWICDSLSLPFGQYISTRTFTFILLQTYENNWQLLPNVFQLCACMCALHKSVYDTLDTLAKCSYSRTNNIVLAYAASPPTAQTYTYGKFIYNRWMSAFLIEIKVGIYSHSKYTSYYSAIKGARGYIFSNTYFFPLNVVQLFVSVCLNWLFRIPAMFRIYKDDVMDIFAISRSMLAFIRNR